MTVTFQAFLHKDPDICIIYQMPILCVSLWVSLYIQMSTFLDINWNGHMKKERILTILSNIIVLEYIVFPWL